MIGVGGRRGWRGGHLLVSELEPLLDGLNVFCGVFGGWRGIASEARSGESVGSRPVAITETENPWGLCGIALIVSIIPGTLWTQALAEGPSSRRARSMLFRVQWLLSLIALPSE